MENCNLNTVTWLYFLEERLSIPLLIVLIVIVITAINIGLRWSAKLVQSALQASATKERKLLNNLREISANVTPVPAVSTDKGELVI